MSEILADNEIEARFGEHFLVLITSRRCNIYKIIEGGSNLELICSHKIWDRFDTNCVYKLRNQTIIFGNGDTVLKKLKFN